MLYLYRDQTLDHYLTRMYNWYRKLERIRILLPHVLLFLDTAAQAGRARPSQLNFRLVDLLTSKQTLGASSMYLDGISHLFVQHTFTGRR